MHEVFEQTDVRTVFSDGSGVFPSYVEIHGRRDLFRTRIALTLEDGQECTPVLPPNPQCRRYRVEHAERLEFYGIAWRDGRGGQTPFLLDLRYEFDCSGTTFLSVFFHAEELHASAIRQFRLTHELRLEEFDDVHWDVFPWPKPMDFLHAVYNKTERHLAPGENRDYADRLIPKVGFSCRNAQSGKNAYLEFFLEGGGALDGKPGNTSSHIRWNDRHCLVTYDFVNNESRRDGVPWQWRNQWGWHVATATPERIQPPLRMFHYLDNFQRYPTDRQIQKMAQNGGDVLILHENWRSDLQNDSFPCNPDELRRTIRTAHRAGLRVALYVRGTEPSIAQEYASWFDHWLEKDRDGLYMDYGSALSEISAPCEWYPEGVFCLRRFLERIYRLRERVGRMGLLLSHTGPAFSAVGMAPHLLNLYVSGEGEVGQMVVSRELHDYYAATAAGPGSMWTAAFPEYGTAKMVPFLAVAGQSPHVPLGVQFPSSSLAHACEPGFESRHLRPIWKLWGLFAHQRDIRFYNHLNSSLKNSALMVAGDGSALLILANFSDSPVFLEEKPDWDFFGIHPQNILRFLPTEETPAPPEAVADLAAKLPAYGVAGFLVNVRKDSPSVQEYLVPYPEQDEADQTERKAIDDQRRLRQHPPYFARTWMRAVVPAMPLPYEDSLMTDFYDIRMDLGYFDDKSAFHHLAWIGKSGLTTEEPAQNACLGNGDASPWMEITAFHKRQLGVRTRHCGELYYSLAQLEFSDQPAVTPNTYAIRFVNELEPHRAFLHWE